MYLGFEAMGDADAAGSISIALEATNEAMIASMPHWGSMERYLEQIPATMKWRYENVACLYVVPFRTRGDNGPAMARSRRGRGYIEQGYQKHLKGKLALLSPGRMLAMDRPAEIIAESYRDEALLALDVLSFTRKRDAHSAGADLLRRFVSGNS